MAISFDQVREIALGMEGVEEGTSYGTPAFKVKKVLFARSLPDLDSIGIRISFDARDKLIASDPKTFYITDHYLNYEWVLIRLNKMRIPTIKKLLNQSLAFVRENKKHSKD